MLKIISLNLERSKHLHLNLPFFQRENPDVLCLQEVLEADIDRIVQETDLETSSLATGYIDRCAG